MSLAQHRKIGILGVGGYLPTHAMLNSDFTDRGLDTTDEWIETRTGIQQRHIVSESQTTSDLATEAAQKALKAANIEPNDLDFIIVATATPDFSGFPSTACLVQQKLGITTHIPCFDLTAACSGFAYGLTVGYSRINSNLGSKGLVIGAESLSKVVDWSDRSSCILFGDGAGAAVIGHVESGGFIAINEGADGGNSNILTTQLTNDTESFNSDSISYPRPVIHMDGRAVFKQGISYVEKTLIALFESCNYDVSDVDHFVAHQANIRILESVSEKFNIPFDKFMVNIDSVGNTSAASIPLVLSKNIDDQKVSKGDIICFIGFGAGFTWSSILLEWSK